MTDQHSPASTSSRQRCVNCGHPENEHTDSCQACIYDPKGPHGFICQQFASTQVNTCKVCDAVGEHATEPPVQAGGDWVSSAACGIHEITHAQACRLLEDGRLRWWQHGVLGFVFREHDTAERCYVCDVPRRAHGIERHEFVRKPASSNSTCEQRTSRGEIERCIKALDRLYRASENCPHGGYPCGICGNGRSDLREIRGTLTRLRKPADKTREQADFGSEGERDQVMRNTGTCPDIRFDGLLNDLERAAEYRAENVRIEGNAIEGDVFGAGCQIVDARNAIHDYVDARRKPDALSSSVQRERSDV